MKRAPELSRSVGAAARGAVIVELALVLPLLALLFLTAIDLGLVIWENQVLQNAAREGARYSSLPRSWIDPRNPGATEQHIIDRVVAYCQEEGITIDPANVTVDQRYPIVVGPVTVFGTEVTVAYVRAFLIPGAPLLPFAQATLSARAVFRNLY